jgi:mycothiol synthase
MMGERLSRRYTVCAATLEHAQAVTDLFNICAVADIGHANTDVTEFQSDWQTPYCNPQTNVRLVLEGDQLVGCAGFWSEPPCATVFGWCRVHPFHKGQGIGTCLAEWMAKAARNVSLAQAPEGTKIALRQTKYDQDADSRELLLSQAYRPIRHFLRMVIDLDVPVPEPRFPAGLKVHTFDRVRDLGQLVRAEQEIFSDHWGYVLHDFERELEAWNHWLDHDLRHDPSVWFLIMGGSEIAGVCLCTGAVTGEPDVGYVASLGVKREWRHRGVGLAMLHLAFGEFYRRGKARVTLDVDADSLTGATRLYEKAGMRILRRQTAYDLVLREGVDLSTQTVPE